MKDMVGFKSGRLTAVSYSHKTNNSGHAWHCLCDCGNTSVVGEYRLRGNYTLSCGCLRKEAWERSVKHGMIHEPIYRRWISMKQRCDNKNIINFEIYGGRGITYADEWKSFQNFYEDMSEGFEEHLELDRIDVNGNYCKENCRWVTHEENNYNKTKQVNNVSGKTGVSWNKRDLRWVSYINFDGKRIPLGTFLTKEEAIRSRKEAEIKYYGYNRD